MLKNFRYSHGGKTFQLPAVHLESEEKVTIEVIVFLAALNKEGLYPYGFRYFDEKQGRKIHYSPEEFYQHFRLSAPVENEILQQRKSM